MRRGLYGVLSFVVLTLVVSYLSEPARAQGIEIFYVDSYSKQCEASSSIEYQWFVYNPFNESFLMQLTVDVESGRGWSSEFEDPVRILEPTEGISVVLIVTAGGDVLSDTINQTVLMTFTQLDDPATVYTIEAYAETEMIPTWGVIAPGKNKLLGNFDNPLPAPYDNNYVTFFLNIGIWAAIGAAFIWVVDPTIRLFTKRTKTDIDDRILKILRRPVFVLVIVFGVVDSLAILPLSEAEVSSVMRVYGIMLIIIVTFVVYKIFKEVIVFLGKRWADRTRSEIDDVLVPVIDMVGGVVIMVFGAISVVNFLGYDITFLLAGVGAAGLILAFAAQDVLSNLFSGITILLDRPFTHGDHIQLATGEHCRVEQIGIRSTRLYDIFKSDYVILPNNKLVNEKVTNLSLPDEQGKGDVAVSVAYGSDVEKVERILLEVAEKHPNVVNTKETVPVVRFTNFGDSALEFKLFFTVDNWINQWRAAHDMRKEIYRRFAEEGIEIPFPHRTVYVKEMPKTR